MKIWVFCSAVVCLMLMSRTESCNEEIHVVTTRAPTNVTSPGYPLIAYPSNLNCWWRIDASTSVNSVIVRVLDSYIESSRNCTCDSLSFYDGPDATGPSLGRLCGQNLTSVISSGRSIYIVFRTDGSNHFKGFLLEFYETTRCGGELTATSDETTFVSPGFPYQYLNNMNCAWLLTAENENDTIVVEFEELQVDMGLAGCLYDYVSVFNDHQNQEKQFLGKFCGSSTPTFQSSRNKLRIDFKTGISGVAKGFSLNYKTVKAGDCNLTMPADSTPMYFVSPGYPDAYDNELECVWQIVSTEQQYIQVAVIASEVEGNYPLCSNDSVAVYEGRGLDAAGLGRFCGNSTPSFISYNRAMTVAFATDDEDEGMGFRIKYNILDAPGKCHSSDLKRVLNSLTCFTVTYPPPPYSQCGSTALTAVRQGNYLESPGYPLGYDNNYQCVWTITASTSDDVVQIVVLDSLLEDESNCLDDFVKVYDGGSTASRMIQVWCGRITPTVQSTGRYMTLLFKTDYSITYKGFRLKYFQTATTPTSECGTSSLTAQTSSQYLQSPGYPNEYPNNEQCVWTITASTSNDVVKIVVLDLSLESGSDCPYDFIKVYDGSSTASRMIQVWCGRITPTVQSTGRHMTLVFKTDHSSTYKGFRLKYFQTATTPTSQCGTSSLTAQTSSQYLQSPGYPNDYPNNEQCVWKITASTSNDVVKIVVLDLSIEASGSDCLDFIKVYDGSSTASRMIQVWCGRITPTVQSTGRYMTLLFKTDYSITYKGFRLKYFQTANSCGGDLSALSYDQYLTSPGYPENYQNNMNCVWTITTVMSDLKIVVHDSDMELSTSCTFDYVEVYDGSNTDGTDVLGRFCGTQTPTFVSSGTSVTIKFISDTSNTHRGFRLSYTGGSFHATPTSQCGTSSLTAQTSSQYLQSPGYPNDYPNNMNCVWTITTYMSYIKIVVLDSYIDPSTVCSYDYVEVYDGSTTENTDLLGKFCGDQSPTIVGSGIGVTIKFHSDSSTMATGFRLSYTGVSFPSCGIQDLVAYTNLSDLYSPNHPYNYPNNADCSWTINTNFDDYVVNIDVISSDLEYSSSCSDDYYEIFDGSDDTFPSLGTYCGSSLPTLRSSGQYLYIKFHSDNSNTGTGFKMTYQTEPSDNYRDPSKLATIVGGCIGCFVLLSVICIPIAVSRKKKPQPVVNQVRNEGINSISQGPYDTTVTPPTCEPPPRYSQVVSYHNPYRQQVLY